MAAGLPLAFAVLQDGSVLGWGFNDYGMLGPAVTVDEDVEFPVPLGVEGVVSMTAEGLALRDDGRVLAWGSEPLGTGIPGDSVVPGEVLGLDQVVKVAGGFLTRFALRQDGTVWAWGKSSSQTCWFANAGILKSDVPVQITGLTGIVDIARAAGAVLAVLSDGTVVSWGRNHYGEMGRGTVATTYCSPEPIPGLGDVVAVAGGQRSSYFLKRDGTVWACGQNILGALGDGSDVDRELPVQVVGLDNIVKIRAGFLAGRAIRSDGTLWAWGLNVDDSLGIDPGREIVYVARQVPLSQPAIDAASGAWHSVVLLADGTVQAAGYGAKPWNNRPAPAPILGPGSVRMLRPAMLVRGDGSLLSWGGNEFGGVGDGTLIDRPAPAQIMASGVQACANGGFSFANFRGALMEDGSVWTWGDNRSGQLGNGTTTSSAVPARSAFLSGIRAIAFGGRHGLALTSAGTIEAWGNNDDGQLGIGGTTESSVPVPVAGLSSVVEIAAGGDVSMARLADGTVWAWGDDYCRQSRSVKVLIPGRVSPSSFEIGKRVSDWAAGCREGATASRRSVAP